MIKGVRLSRSIIYLSKQILKGAMVDSESVISRAYKLTVLKAKAGLKTPQTMLVLFCDISIVTLRREL